MKSAAGVAALAALGLVAVNYSASEGSQLFLSERISEEEMLYMKYVTEFGKSYGTRAEFEFRMEQFKNSLAKMAFHNADNAHGSTVGLNQFADWTDAEYKRLLGYRAPKNVTLEETELSTVDIPTAIDWRTRGAVNAVKNQGQCGSCWAFSATASIEGHHAIQQGQLLSLAEQQLVDCDNTCYGCNGGW